MEVYLPQNWIDKGREWCNSTALYTGYVEISLLVIKQTIYLFDLNPASKHVCLCIFVWQSSHPGWTLIAASTALRMSLRPPSGQ